MEHSETIFEITKEASTIIKKLKTYKVCFLSTMGIKLEHNKRHDFINCKNI
jgi:hypothetical protein